MWLMIGVAGWWQQGQEGQGKQEQGHQGRPLLRYRVAAVGVSLSFLVVLELGRVLMALVCCF